MLLMVGLRDFRALLEYLKKELAIGVFEQPPKISKR